MRETAGADGGGHRVTKPGRDLRPIIFRREADECAVGLVRTSKSEPTAQEGGRRGRREGAGVEGLK